VALTKEKKQAIVDEVADLLSDSKLTVVARYQGTAVQPLQDLRRQARDSQTSIRVIKNRLVKKALAKSGRFKDLDDSFLTGQLIYAFNSADELAPAQVLAQFAKSQPQIEFVAGLTAEGLLPAADVKALSELPGKEALKGQLVGLIAGPLGRFSSLLAANPRGVTSVLLARADKIS
jgi:large subunit ribosomal protein L10